MRSLLLKRLFITAISCMLLMPLCACGSDSGHEVILYDPGSGNDENDKVSLTFFGYKADAINLTAIENAMQSFMAEYRNIDISYEGIKGREYWDVFDKRDAAGVLDDIIMMNHDHIVQMSAQNKLADLSDITNLENYTDEVKEQFMNTDGSVYFLPILISTYNLYINYDLLRAHGQNVPENWEDFQKCCDYFVSKGIVPIIANNYNSLNTLIISKGLYDVYQRQDVDDVLKKFNDDPLLLADALVPGVEQTAEMIKRGWFDTAEVMITEQTSDDLELFLKGDRPFMISGGWASVRVDAGEPGFSYGVHPYPIMDDGCVLSIQIDTCISINANNDHIREAKDFLNYLIEPDVMWAYCDSQASYTPLENDDRLPSSKALAPSNEYMSNGRVVFRNEYRLRLPVETALSECAHTLLNGGTAAEAEKVLSEALLN